MIAALLTSALLAAYSGGTQRDDFVFSAPCELQFTQQQQETKIGRVTVHLYACSRDGFQYRIGVEDRPPGFTQSDLVKFLGDSGKRMKVHFSTRGMGYSSIYSCKPHPFPCAFKLQVSVGSAQTLSYDAAIPGGGQFIGKLYMTKTRLYNVLCIVPPGADLGVNPDSKTHASSFTLLDM